MRSAAARWATAALLLWPGAVLRADGNGAVGPAPETPERPAAQSLPDPEAKSPAAKGGGLNGFDLSKLVVDRAAIVAGGPLRDRIRSVDAPELVPRRDALWAPPPVPVIGVSVGDAAHAYPVHILEYHQIVNDEVGGHPIVVSYDPLTGIPMAHESTVEGRRLRFGVSGLLYRGQFLLYDRETESLWAHYEGLAVAGPMAGKRLVRHPVRQEPMGVWYQRHPETTVLARPEPRRIDYRYSPYEVYWISDEIPFPVEASDSRYHPKEVVLGVEVDGRHRAYLGSILTAEGGRIVDDFEGRKLRIDYDSESSNFIWEAPADVQVTDAYWFAWKALEPKTQIWRDKEP